MASEGMAAETRSGTIGMLAGRLAEVSQVTALTALDALIATSTVEDRAASARLARTLAEHLSRSVEELQNGDGGR
jgi:hypothetical protein